MTIGYGPLSEFKRKLSKYDVSTRLPEFLAISRGSHFVFFLDVLPSLKEEDSYGVQASA